MNRMLLVSSRALICENQVSKGAEILHLLLQEVVVKTAEAAVRVPMGVVAHTATMVAVLIAPVVLVVKEITKEVERRMRKEEGVKPEGRTNMARLGERRTNRVSTILALTRTNVENVWGDIPVLSVFATRSSMTNRVIFVKTTAVTFFTPPVCAGSRKVDMSRPAQKNRLFLLTEKKMMKTMKKSTFIDNQIPLLIY